MRKIFSKKFLLLSVVILLIAFAVYDLLPKEDLTYNRLDAKVIQTAKADQNMFLNNSASELDSNGNPKGWQKESWGTNSSTFSYLKEGNNSDGALKVVISDYKEGDSKWVQNSLPVTAGHYYEFSDSYKSNVPTKVVVEIVNNNDQVNYIGLKLADASADWSTYVDKFDMPADAKTAKAYHLIDTSGYLITDNYVFSPADIAPFDQGIISLTFDDGWESVYQNAFPLMKSKNINGTVYLVPKFLNTSKYLTDRQVKKLKKNGFEIGSHSLNHSDMTTLSQQALKKEMKDSRADLSKRFGKVTNFAFPFGIYNENVLKSGFLEYKSTRTTDPGFNTKDNFSPSILKVQNVNSGTSQEDINKWVDEASLDKSWLILLYHQIDNKGGEYSVTPDKFKSQLEKISSSDLKVLSVDQALETIRTQY